MLLCVYQPSDILDIVVISAYKSHNAKYRFVSQNEILDVKQNSIYYTNKDHKDTRDNPFTESKSCRGFRQKKRIIIRQETKLKGNKIRK